MPDPPPNEPFVYRGPERRNWPRSPGRVADVLLRDKSGCTCHATVVNESLTGLAVMVGDAMRLEPGDEVRLRYKNRWSFAVVQHVQHGETRSCWVGLEWGCSETRFAGLNAAIEAFCAELGPGAGG